MLSKDNNLISLQQKRLAGFVSPIFLSNTNTTDSIFVAFQRLVKNTYRDIKKEYEPIQLIAMS